MNIQFIYWTKRNYRRGKLRVKIDGRAYWCGKNVAPDLFVRLISSEGIIELENTHGGIIRREGIEVRK